jgi:hypothetical protein
MMDILHWGLNILCLAGVIWLVTKRPGDNSQALLADLRHMIQMLESRLSQAESDLQGIRSSLEDKMNALENVCEQANRLLKNQRLSLGSFPVTQEESELKEALYLDSAKDPIPCVAELENTKLRLQKESSLDLKTLLKGQLV